MHATTTPIASKRHSYALSLGIALREEGLDWLALLRSRSMWLWLALLTLLCTLAVNFPLSYTVAIGIADRYGADTPIVSGFNDPEHDELGAFRWTDEGATLHFDGVGRRPLLLTLSFRPISPDVAARGPKTTRLDLNGAAWQELPVQATGRVYRLPMTAEQVGNGEAEIRFHTETFTFPDDPRNLGTPLRRAQLVSLAPSIPVLPSRVPLLLWAGIVVLWCGLVRKAEKTESQMTGRPDDRTPRQLHSAPRLTFWLSGFLVLLIGLSAVLDPPRWSLGAQAELTAALSAYLLVMLLRLGLPRLAALVRIPLPPIALTGLLIIIGVSFALRIGARLYPDSMPGDIGFHTNRFHETVQGKVLLMSRHRGVDFPYPSGPYLLLAPFKLFNIPTRLLLPYSAALIDSLGAALVYAIMARLLQTFHARFRPSLPLLAGGLYVFVGATWMTTWWSFSTHIHAQFFALLLTTALVLTFVSRQRTRSSFLTPPNVNALPFYLPSATGLALIALSAALMLLGHFSFFLNWLLLGGLLLAVLLVMPARVLPNLHVQRRALWLTFGGALLGVLTIYYGWYLPMFAAQAQVASQSGLPALSQHVATPLALLWDDFWREGLITHYGFFPIMLAPLGLLLLLRRWHTAWIVVLLVGGTFLIDVLFAGLPFLTGSTLSTRWLMFSVWAVAVGAALVVPLLLRTGRGGRWMVAAMGAYVLWNSAVIWLGGMAWKIRPPEPF